MAPEKIPAVGFRDQVVVITGAGRGIGRGHAALFGRLGARVLANDLDAGVLAELVDLLRGEGCEIEAAPGDVVEYADRIVDAALERWGRIDAVVNNAGTPINQPFSATSLADAKRLFRVHALGAMAVTQAAWEALQASGGRVVNTTSGALFGLPGSTAYAMAKGAVLGLTKSIAAETATTGVRANALMPMARTRMFEAAGGVAGSAEDDLMTAQFPAHAIAPAAAYLAWEHVPFNGQILEVAGGSLSRIVFATTPDIDIASPEDVGHGVEVLTAGPLEELTDLAQATMRKLGLGG